MTSEIDVYRSAKLMIDQHGGGAAIQSAMEADAMLDKGDLDGATIWPNGWRLFRGLVTSPLGATTFAIDLAKPTRYSLSTGHQGKTRRNRACRVACPPHQMIGDSYRWI